MKKLEYYFDDIETCECIGNFEDEYVYDIEVDDDSHTFIGNDILVHNSLYISFLTIAETAKYDMTSLDDGLKFILHINGNFIKFLFSGWLVEYAKKYHVKNIHNFELETINKSGMHIDKKMYINNPVWEDSVFYADLSHYTPKGIDIVRSSTPLFVREKIWDFINYLFLNPRTVNVREILKIMTELKKQFEYAPIEEISNTTSLSNYDVKCIDDQNDIVCVKGAHFSVKAAAFHNYLLNNNSEYKTKYDLLKGGKIKWYFCKHHLNERFAYMRNFHPSEICQKEGVEVDYQQQFSKTFLAVVNRFILTLGFSPITKRVTILNSLFSTPVKAALKEENLVDIDVEFDEEIDTPIIDEDEIDLDNEYDPLMEYDNQ